jgi:hypothetical protein
MNGKNVQKHEMWFEDTRSSSNRRAPKVGMNFLNGFLPHIIGAESNIKSFCVLTDKCQANFHISVRPKLDEIPAVMCNLVRHYQHRDEKE